METAGPQSLGLYVEVCVCVRLCVCVCMLACLCVHACVLTAAAVCSTYLVETSQTAVCKQALYLDL